MTQVFTSPLLAGVTHGFSGRRGGVSPAPFGSLNLNRSTGDFEGNIQENRRRLLDHFGFQPEQLCLLSQVHGLKILPARPGVELQEADAQHSARPGLLLAITWADCLPVLFFDPASGAVAAAHCGWRGSLGRLAGKMVEEMRSTYGTRPEQLRVAIGPGICRDCYQVSADVADPFEGAGFGDFLKSDPGPGQHWRLDLHGVNRRVLLDAGVDPANVDSPGICTSCSELDFFSHRRDRGATGRHWALIAPAAPD